MSSTRHPRFSDEDHQRIKETLDSLNDSPTEEEAEAILRTHGTSGKEVVNQFIEQLLRENLELKTKLDLALKCIECGHLKREFINGVCQAEIEPPYYGEGDYREGRICGCECRFEAT